jgi:hypothetical protein
MVRIKDKNILIISPEPWGHIFVSKHHYAIHLSGRANNKVFFLNPPSSKNYIQKTTYRNVWEINYTGFPKGLRFLPGFIQRWFIKMGFIALQNLAKVKFDIIWSFDNSVFFDFSALPKKVLRISHIVDLNQDFQTKKAAETADICFGTSKTIIENLKGFNRKAYFINHGFSYSQEQVNEDIRMPGRNSVKAFCAGNLNISYIDWELLKRLVIDNYQVDFILAGPWNGGGLKRELTALANVYYVGAIDSGKLGAYYRLADLLLIIYQADEFHAQLSNPHKMMEYLSSGKMIVTTYTEEYMELADQGLFLMSHKNKELPDLFKAAVQNMAKWNGEERQKARKAYALENTYDKQIDKIEAYLKPILEEKCS